MPTVHRNLNPCRKHAGGCAWSVKATSSAPVSHADCVVAHGITAKQPSGKKFEACHAGTGNRAVFAYFKAESVEVLDCAEMPGNVAEYLAGAQRVRFNPKTDRFFHVDGRRIDSLAHAVFLPSGECWGVTR